MRSRKSRTVSSSGDTANDRPAQRGPRAPARDARERDGVRKLLDLVAIRGDKELERILRHALTNTYPVAVALAEAENRAFEIFLALVDAVDVEEAVQRVRLAEVQGVRRFVRSELRGLENLDSERSLQFRSSLRRLERLLADRWRTRNRIDF